MKYEVDCAIRAYEFQRYLAEIAEAQVLGAGPLVTREALDPLWEATTRLLTAGRRVVDLVAAERRQAPPCEHHDAKYSARLDAYVCPCGAVRAAYPGEPWKPLAGPLS